jgi:hypothetical protein
MGLNSNNGNRNILGKQLIMNALQIWPVVSIYQEKTKRHYETLGQHDGKFSSQGVVSDRCDRSNCVDHIPRRVSLSGIPFYIVASHSAAHLAQFRFLIK